MEYPDKKLKACIKDSFHCERLNLTLQDFNTRETFSDLYFICKRGVRVKAHKLVVSSVSTHLKQMFLELPETIRLQDIYVSVPDIEARILRLVFDFLYEGQVTMEPGDNPKFNEVMSLLGFNLTSEADKQSSAAKVAPQTVTQPSPQMVYLQGAPSTQGQVQYLMASPSALTGQVIQAPLMTPMVQANIAQPSQQPMIVTQADGQLVQTGGQIAANQVQQMQVVQQNNAQILAMNNQMQVVQQNQTPIVSMNNQMVAGNQIVNGNQLIQCSSQAVVQGNQPIMVNNNQMQVGMQNQVVANNNYVVNQQPQQQQQQQQHLRTATNNVMSTSRQFTRTQPNQRSQAVVRGRTAAAVQPQTLSRVNNPNGTTSCGNLSVEDILMVLQEHNDDLMTLTAKKLRMSLEDKFKVDFSNQEDVIQQVLQSVLSSEDAVEGENIESKGLGLITSVVSLAETSRPQLSQVRKTKQSRRRVFDPKSDDEADEDFNPRKSAKRKSNKK